METKNLNTKYCVGLGEILFDVLPSGSQLGGAPANFAYHAGQHGLHSVAVSAVGKDALGDTALRLLDEKKLKYVMPEVDYPTGTVQVQLDKEGVPTYDIKQGVAWDNIPFTDDIKEIAANAGAVCWGSLAQRSEVSRKTNPYVIIRDFDRSAPLGTGIYKVGGNYAASLRANHIAHEKGYACEFYLDAKEKKYMDECGAANFFGIKNNTYVTPKSTSILPSITNKSLMQLAEDLGMKVERRQIPEDELETFEEAGACGTAAVISPISYIDDLDTGKRYNFGEKPGPISKHLYDTLRGIQYGTIEDKHGWTTVVIE
jgi:hypothetical protein